MTIVRDLLGTFRKTHDKQKALSQHLTAEQLRTTSYDSEWTVADLLSHMGSQAEIMDMFVNASVTGEEAPARELFTGVWDRWNAMTPEDQRDSSIASTQASVALLESLTDEQIDAIDIPFFGEIDGADFIRIRLGESAVHTWDLAVTFDSTALIAADAVPAILPRLPMVVGRYSYEGSPFTLQVHTSDPEHAYVITAGEKIELTQGTADTSNTLHLPSEAFVRLLFGRLDADHTPASAKIEGDLGLDDLRKVFVGF